MKHSLSCTALLAVLAFVSPAAAIETQNGETQNREIQSDEIQDGLVVGDRVGTFAVTKVGGCDDGVKVNKTLCYR